MGGTQAIRHRTYKSEHLDSDWHGICTAADNPPRGVNGLLVESLRGIPLRSDGQRRHPAPVRSSRKREREILMAKGKSHVSEMNSQERLNSLVVALDPLRLQLLDHAVYRSIRSVEDLRIFLQHHIFAVWDFMSLLKALQVRVTGVSVPWLPMGDPVTRRMLNEIILEEESDVSETGEIQSHFEMYREMMGECGADTRSIDRFIGLLRDGEWIEMALDLSEVPPAARRFVLSTWRVIETRSPHSIAAGYVFGREHLIRDMYRALIADLRGRFLGVYERFEKYLDRLIGADGDRHKHCGVPPPDLAVRKRSGKMGGSRRGRPRVPPGKNRTLGWGLGTD